jgi:hypothetical protein
MMKALVEYRKKYFFQAALPHSVLVSSVNSSMDFGGGVVTIVKPIHAPIAIIWL